MSGNLTAVGEFDCCQGNVRKLADGQGIVKEKSCQGKGKLFIISFTFGATPVSTSMVVA